MADAPIAPAAPLALTAPMTRLVAQGETARTFELSELPALLKDPANKIWIDLANAGRAGFEQLEPALMFHPMAIDDCIMDVNFPRVDDYDQYVYLAVHSARWEDGDVEPVLKELDVLLGKNYLVTYHEEPTRGIEKALDLVTRRGQVLSRGPDHLLYLILDVMVDNYMPILEKIQTRVDEFEERVVRTPSRELLTEVLHFKRAAATLRRIVGPQRDTLLALTRDEFTVIRPEMRPYLRDVYDRLARISDLLDSFRDELATMLDIYVSQVSNSLNEVMKVLTAITVVIVPVTLVASIYGMNVKFPGIDTRHGFYEAMGIMVLTAIAMLLYFRSRKWL